jgi:RNA polymerase sigma factor (sigma-70 family)
MTWTTPSIDTELPDDVSVGPLDTSPHADAFRHHADRSIDASYRLARLIVGPDDAPDAVQDAYLAAWRAWPTLRDPERFDAWFGRILVNTCRNRRRRASHIRVVDISDQLGVADAASGADHAATDRRIDLVAALATLGTEDRTLLALRYVRDLPVDAVAGILGVPSGTVKSRLHRALDRLRKTLEDAATEARP